MVHSNIFCTNCGAENPTQNAFCPVCGQTLQVSTSSSQYSMTASGSSIPTGKLPPNHLLKHRYRISSLVGQGGMGAVYKAEDTLFHNRLVAVKEMSKSGLSKQEIVKAVAAFKHEAHMLADLDHQSLPKIHDYFEEAGRWYLVMDFIDGQMLEDYINIKGGKLPVQEVLDIGLQLCNVLSYLHTRQQPIIFRDLKPSNIMRTPDGDLYLIDFGIARHFKPGQTKDTYSLGSPGYAAPEQFGKLTTPQSDIYSLGALLHEMLSGHDPSTNTPNLFTFPSLPKIPTKLERLIEQMVQVNASHRPATIAEVKRELQLIVSLAPPVQSAPSQINSSPQAAQLPTAQRQQILVPPPQKVLWISGIVFLILVLIFILAILFGFTIVIYL